MHRGPETIPADTLRHLTRSEVDAAWELTSLARLVELGEGWHGLALPAAFEERFYRLNSLPHQLNGLYRGLDPSDPDEDIVEEAEAAATALVGEHYLLDESVDLLYDSLAGAGPTTVRRAGDPGGVVVSGRRAVLLAVKRLYRDDWTAAAVMDRLAATATLGLEARPVLITPAPEREAPGTALRLGALLGQGVRAWLDDAGRLVRLSPA